jgi:hypothetical protein
MDFPRDKIADFDSVFSEISVVVMENILFGGILWP